MQVGAESKRLGSSPAITPPTALLRADVPTILRATARQLKDKSPKTKAGAIQVLKELVDVLPEAIAADIDQLVPGILAALNVCDHLSACQPNREPLSHHAKSE